MPCISGQFDRTTGLIIIVLLSQPGGVKAARTAAQTAAAQGLESSAQLSAAGVPALIDTGADSTCISSALAQRLELRPHGKMRVVGATGPKPMNTYLVDLAIMFGDKGLVTESIQVTEFHNSSPHYEVLLGRDIICQGVLTLGFDGHYSFSL